MTASYKDTLAYIHSFKNYEITAPDTIPEGAWDLSRITDLLGRLGDPHRAYPVIHIAGSKGKGSTAAFCTQVLVETGLKTGLYISPHLLDFRERIQINREWISKEALIELTEAFKPHAAGVPALTWFEVLTALAFWHFAREAVDVAVIEVGLGGRLDATNVVTPAVSVITRIGLDHTQLLGESLAEIAGEKAAIIKPGISVVSGPQVPEAVAVIAEVAKRQGSPLSQITPYSPHFDDIEDEYSWAFEPFHNESYGVTVHHAGESRSYPLGLPGLYQAENATVALAALNDARQRGIPFAEEAVARGLRNTRWRGRLEFLSEAPLLVVDSAHNPPSAKALAKELAHLDERPTWTLIFGCMADKDAEQMLGALLPRTKRVILTRANHPRAMAVEALATFAQATGIDTRIEMGDTVSTTLAQTLDSASETDRICVAGSLAVAGEAIAVWERLSIEPADFPPSANRERIWE